ncbi:alpha/beta fold hydrolase [Nonomuraea sp. LPB2021202275-12-8]|uniref:alpha/beta fold hydrolase n=1 Tax=Nonomuraea sp. LPB2021202275-12-8 TaxID=3120159 RepID=UPI00300D5F74
MRRTIAALAGAAFLAAAVPASASSHEPGEPDWRACGPHGMLCAAITVPVRDRSTSLRLAMLPATGARRGAVLYAPGGPGKDGIQQVRDSAPILADLRRHFDVVAFETRYEQTMKGLPESCSVAAAPLMSEPSDRADFDRQATRRREAFTRCAAGDGTGLFARTDSAAVARDMDAIRAALGERRINVMAESYGGITATAYARLFPHRIRVMHLDSTVDHTGTSSAPQAMDANERMLRRFAEWCAVDDSCAPDG